ncbi:MAG: hypothetical protein Q7J47_06225 [Azoarcus sp.]|nr:hypothetical protein [Azoarcus sp.]
MTPEQLRRREALVARNDAALERWPDHTGPGFTSEMAAVAEGFKALAHSIPLSERDAVECSRTWRWAGNAYYDLGAGKDLAALERAAEAYRKAENALEAATGADDAVEWTKLNYSFGKVLLQLSEAKDLGLATNARTRLRAALTLARLHMPDGVESVQEELATAQQIVSLLSEVGHLDQQMAQLKNELRLADSQEPRHTQRSPERAAEAKHISSMFDVLNQQFEKEKPSLDPTRQVGLSSLMQRLQGMVESATSEGLSLDAMMANRGKMDALQRELNPQVRRPSLKGPVAAQGSRGERLLAALQELKMFVGAAGMAPDSSADMREAAMDLFARLGRLTTWVSQAGDDKATLDKLESDQARALAHEVRLSATLRHQLLARPVWPRVEAMVDANRVFFSGGMRMRKKLASALSSTGLELAADASIGADFATHRWQELRSSNLAVFDISEMQAQVYYELGIALTIGAQILLIAADDIKIPFDIAQNVSRYKPGDALRPWLADEVQAAIYGLSVKGGKESSLAATFDYAKLMATGEPDNSLLVVALKVMSAAGDDPIKFRNALTTFNTYLGARHHELLQTRWPGMYPSPRAPRTFAVMPFRHEREAAYAVIEATARQAGIEPVRGDQADGQEIIESIWQEICRATHVTVDLSGFNPNVCLELGMADALGRPTLLIGEQGTEQQMDATLPGVAKRRCHTYAVDPGNDPQFARALKRFFATA